MQAKKESALVRSRSMGAAPAERLTGLRVCLVDGNRKTVPAGGLLVEDRACCHRRGQRRSFPSYQKNRCGRRLPASLKRMVRPMLMPPRNGLERNREGSG